MLAVVHIASGAIKPLRRGRRFFIWRRRIPQSLTPSLEARCRCGHTFAVHAWRTRRRWVRLVRPSIAFEDRASACEECACAAFRYRETRRLIRALRQMRILTQAPSVGD